MIEFQSNIASTSVPSRRQHILISDLLLRVFVSFFDSGSPISSVKHLPLSAHWLRRFELTANICNQLSAMENSLTRDWRTPIFSRRVQNMNFRPRFLNGGRIEWVIRLKKSVTKFYHFFLPRFFHVSAWVQSCQSNTFFFKE